MINLFETSTPDPYAAALGASSGLDAYKRRLLAAQLLQKQASTDEKVYTPAHGNMKLLAAILGGGLEAYEENKAKRERQALLEGAPGSATASAAVSPSAPSPSVPSIGGTSGGAPKISADQKALYDGLIQRGVSPIVAAGALGNFAGESGFKTDIWGDNNTSFGLAQWRGPRLEALRALAAKQGKDPSDPDVQLDHFVAELNGPEAKAYAAAQQAKTPEEAALAIAQHYERPAAWALQQSGPKRAAAARQAFDQFGAVAPAQVASADPNFVPAPAGPADLPVENAATAATGGDGKGFFALPNPGQDPSIVPADLPVESGKPAGLSIAPAESAPALAPLPPERPPETYTPRPPQASPQAMAAALQAPAIDPNSNDAGAKQFAASGMGTDPRALAAAMMGRAAPQAAPQGAPPPASAPVPPPQPRPAPSAPQGMYGGSAPSPSVAAPAPAPAAPPAANPAPAPARPAADPQAYVRKIILSEYLSPQEKQMMIQQVTPDHALQTTPDGDIIAINKRNPKDVSVVYRASVKGVVLPPGSSMVHPTTGQPLGNTQPSGAPFPGANTEERALNLLVQQGKLSPAEAANVAAGKTVTTGDGTIVFLTPQGIMAKPGTPAQGGAPQSAPGVGAATQAPGVPQREGVIPVGPPKATEEQKVQEKARGEAKVALGDVLAKSAQALDTIDKVRSHPGRESFGATGLGSTLPVVGQGIPGTQGRDFVALVDQLKGKSFLEAFDTLKGGGQITEVEGKKATDAIARLDRAQSKEGFNSALKDLEDVVKIGRKRAYEKAGVPPAHAEALEGAAEAIRRGASRDKVIERLRQNGVEPMGL